MTKTDSEGYYQYIRELRSTLNLVRAAPNEWHAGSAVRAASLELAHEIVAKVHAGTDGDAGKEVLYREALTLAGALILRCRGTDPAEWPFGVPAHVEAAQHVAS